MREWVKMTKQKIVSGNILHVRKGYIFHQVNCQGVMGAGLALQIKNAFPNVFKHYQNLIRKDGANTLGKAQVVKVGKMLNVVNIFGQLGFGRDKRHTDYDALEAAFSSLDVSIREREDIYFPYGFGCGLAGGDWKIVSSLIAKYFPNVVFVKY